MRAAHHIHSFTKLTITKTAKISGKTYYYVRNSKSNLGRVWSGYLGRSTSYTNGSGNVSVKGNTINFYNHVNQGDYKSNLSHYGRNYRNRNMQINKLAKKSGTSGYYLRVKYNGKTWGWIHQNGVTYKGSKTPYTAISNKTTVTIKSNATNGFFNHVNGGNYLNHLIHYGKNYRGKKFTTNMKAKKTGTSGYYYRVYYHGKNYGWIHQTAFVNVPVIKDNTQKASNANNSSSKPTSNNSNSTNQTGSDKTHQNSSSSTSKNSSSNKPINNSSSNESSNDSYVEPHFDDIDINAIKKGIVKYINAYRAQQAHKEGITNLNEQYWAFNRK